MTFDTITDALKWCLDHPGQKLIDKEGRVLWFDMDERRREMLSFNCNLVYSETRGEDRFPVNFTDLHLFDLPTLSPKKTEPEKPTLNNLAALENWDWFRVTLPSGQVDSPFERYGGWDTLDYTVLINALDLGWPVEFGRDEA